MQPNMLDVKLKLYGKPQWVKMLLKGLPFPYVQFGLVSGVLKTIIKNYKKWSSRKFLIEIKRKTNS